MDKEERIREIRKCFGLSEIPGVRQTKLGDFEGDEIFEERDLEDVIHEEIARIAKLIKSGGTPTLEDFDKFQAALDFETVRDKDEYGY